MDEKSIYSYSDYRSFLKDYFDFLKTQRKQFSHRFIAQRCGFSSHSFFGKIINGERNLSEDSLVKIIKGFNFKGQTEKYFYALVHYNQSHSLVEKEKWYSELISNRKSNEYFQLNQNHINYYEHWYLPVLKHLVVNSDWSGDYQKLAKLVFPPISVTEAKKGVEALLKIGLMEEKKGKYISKSKALNVENLPDFVKIKGREEILKKGIEALGTLGKDQRYTAASLLTMSHESYSQVVNVLEDARKKIQYIALNDTKMEKVYQLVLQMFPTSRNFNMGKSGDKTE